MCVKEKVLCMAIGYVRVCEPEREREREEAQLPQVWCVCVCVCCSYNALFITYDAHIHACIYVHIYELIPTFTYVGECIAVPLRIMQLMTASLTRHCLLVTYLCMRLRVYGVGSFDTCGSTSSAYYLVYVHFSSPSSCLYYAFLFGVIRDPVLIRSCTPQSFIP
jgi:hypothetical protein